MSLSPQSNYSLVTRCWKISIWSTIINGFIVTMVTTFMERPHYFEMGEYDVMLEVLNVYTIWVVFFYKEELMRGADFSTGRNVERIP